MTVEVSKNEQLLTVPQNICLVYKILFEFYFRFSEIVIVRRGVFLHKLFLKCKKLKVFRKKNEPEVPTVMQNIQINL